MEALRGKLRAAEEDGTHKTAVISHNNHQVYHTPGEIAIAESQALTVRVSVIGRLSVHTLQFDQALGSWGPSCAL